MVDFLIAIVEGDIDRPIPHATLYLRIARELGLVTPDGRALTDVGLIVLRGIGQ